MKRALQILWASPTTLVGLLLAFLGGAVPCGVIRGQVLQFKSAWGFWKWLNGRGFTATTFANVSIFAPGYVGDETTQKHECVHVAQCYRWGPLFLPMYGLASLVAFAEGGDDYRDNYFERAAYAQQSWGEWAI